MSNHAARVLLAFLALPLIAVSHAAPQKTLSVETIFANGPIAGTPPDELTWSPNASHLSYLDGGELVDIDPASGKPHVLIGRSKLATLNEGRVSETDRDHRARYKMSSYIWSPDSTHILFDSDGRLWLYDLHNGTGVEIGFTGLASGDDPKFSPDGKAVSFVRDNTLSVIRLRDPGTPIVPLAPSPNESILNGKVDWVYEEELDVRSNYFWSPDSSHLAYLQMNESAVPSYPIEDWLTTHASVEPQRYPQPGDSNPDVRVGVVSEQGGRTVWIKLPIQPGNDYIPRFGWADRHTLWIETITRDHKHRNIYLADPESGQSHSILQIDDEKFLDENYDVWLSDGKLVLTNWTDGHNHLYLYSFNSASPATTSATLVRQLTSGDFEVGTVGNVDFKAKQIEYASNEGNPLEQQLWTVGFDGQRKQLSVGAGTHAGNFAPSGGEFVDTQSTRLDPPALRLCHSSDRCSVVWQTRSLEPYHLRAPQQIEIKAHDGSTLYATILFPEGANSPASVPLIVNPYGGPGPQTVANRWSASLLFDELLAQHGFAVLHADNRGTGMRGRAFAQAAWHNFGPIQLEDQLTVVDAVLQQYPQLDSKRLGWWGWSWGGTFTLYAMTHSDRFRAGVCVAPVTDWRNYDSVYTERYMSEPAAFPAGYKDFSVVNSAANLKGRLLLVHGTGDDNVHFQNTAQFVQKLIEAHLPYDLQIYPRKTHSLAGPDVQTHLYNRILAQFEQYLKPAQ